MISTREPLQPSPESIAQAMAARRADDSAPFLVASRGDVPSRIPMWMMRQAGRSLPEYRELREGTSMLDSCFNSQMLAEITMQPVRRFDADAAILFSDIVVPLKAAGVPIEIVPGRGPVLESPIDTMEAVEALPVVTAIQLSSIADGISLVLKELRKDQVLIGFAGAPFTVASYLVEGGSSKNHVKTKSLMYSQPEVWHALMEKLTPTIQIFLQMQLEAGVDSVQLFDSWAGFLTLADYKEYVAAYSEQIFDFLEPYKVPRIHFGVGTSELLGAMAQVGPDIVGVDWRTPLDSAAWKIDRYLDHNHMKLDRPKAHQGNLDPAVLFAGEAAIAEHVHRIIAEAAKARREGHSRGHIFNLGHGVLPETNPEAIKYAFDTVHAAEVTEYNV